MRHHVGNTTTMLGAEHDPMYWLMPLGLAVGIAVVWAFERLADKQQGRQDLFTTRRPTGESKDGPNIGS